MQQWSLGREKSPQVRRGAKQQTLVCDSHSVSPPKKPNSPKKKINRVGRQAGGTTPREAPLHPPGLPQAPKIAPNNVARRSSPALPGRTLSPELCSTSPYRSG